MGRVFVVWKVDPSSGWEVSFGVTVSGDHDKTPKGALAENLIEHTCGTERDSARPLGPDLHIYPPTFLTHSYFSRLASTVGIWVPHLGTTIPGTMPRQSPPHFVSSLCKPEP